MIDAKSARKKTEISRTEKEKQTPVKDMNEVEKILLDTIKYKKDDKVTILFQWITESGTNKEFIL